MFCLAPRRAETCVAGLDANFRWQKCEIFIMHIFLKCFKNIQNVCRVCPTKKTILKQKQTFLYIAENAPGSHNGGAKEPHAAREPRVADPWAGGFWMI